MASSHYRNRIAAFYHPPQPHLYTEAAGEPPPQSETAIRRATLQIAKICRQPRELLADDELAADKGRIFVVATVLFAAGVATIVGALPTLIESAASALSNWAGISPPVAMVLAGGCFLLLGALAVALAVFRITRSVQQSDQAVDDLRWRILFLEESIRRLERTRPSSH